MKLNKKQSAYKLHPYRLKELEKIAGYEGISLAAAIEMLIENFAKQKNLQITEAEKIEVAKVYKP